MLTHTPIQSVSQPPPSQCQSQSTQTTHTFVLRAYTQGRPSQPDGDQLTFQTFTEPALLCHVIQHTSTASQGLDELKLAVEWILPSSREASIGTSQSSPDQGKMTLESLNLCAFAHIDESQPSSSSSSQARTSAPSKRREAPLKGARKAEVVAIRYRWPLTVDGASRRLQLKFASVEDAATFVALVQHVCPISSKEDKNANASFSKLPSVPASQDCAQGCTTTTTAAAASATAAVATSQPSPSGPNLPHRGNIVAPPSIGLQTKPIAPAAVEPWPSDPPADSPQGEQLSILSAPATLPDESKKRRSTPKQATQRKAKVSRKRMKEGDDGTSLENFDGATSSMRGTTGKRKRSSHDGDDQDESLAMRDIAALDCLPPIRPCHAADLGRETSKSASSNCDHTVLSTTSVERHAILCPPEGQQGEERWEAMPGILPSRYSLEHEHQSREQVPLPNWPNRLYYHHHHQGSSSVGGGDPVTCDVSLAGLCAKDRRELLAEADAIVKSPFFAILVGVMEGRSYTEGRDKGE